jgi:hypothetical protein
MKRLFSRKHLALWMLAAAALVLVIALVVASPWASKSPDSLEKVQQKSGVSSKTTTSLLKDYQVPGVAGKQTSTRLSAVLGVFITLAVVLALGSMASWLGRRQSGAAALTPATAPADGRGPSDEA